MRIGIIAPPWVPVPPTHYGGTEGVIDDLARSLQQLGHAVELFTIGDSTCPVPRVSVRQRPVTPMGTTVEEAAHVLAAYDVFGDVDVIHDHTVLGPLIAPLVRPDIPVVVTQHGPFDEQNRRIFALIARTASVVAISRSQARQAGTIPVAAVILHGIDLDRYHPGTSRGDRLLFLGRMSPDKGVANAIRIARAAGRELVLVVKMREPPEQEYFQQEVAPLLGSDIDLVIEPPLPRKVELLQDAAALLNPIRWAEPFGLVMAEALACGTPVIATPCGAAPEIVDDGVTGFLRSDAAGLAEAIGHLDEIDPAACRLAAQRRFSRLRMAADYLEVYGSAHAPNDADCDVVPASLRPPIRSVGAGPGR